MSQQNGRYEFIEEIGSGGFATVFKARDKRLDRLVAVKVMRPLLMSDADFIMRFQREAQVAANLQHPNIVPIYDYGEFEGRLFLVMKLMTESVAERLEKGQITWEQAVTWITQAAAGLDFAHTRNMIHRDIKPDNLLLDESDNIVVGDFGVVKALEKSTITVSMNGGILGTPPYMAPEVWNGEIPTPGTDIYALACVLYEMVSGHRLFDGPTPPATMTLHFREPALPAQWAEDVPPGLTQVLQHALAQQVADRYASAMLFANDLNSLKLDPLQEQYDALQKAVNDEKWGDAIALAEAILAQDTQYKDTTALLTRAMTGKATAEQALLINQWREQAEEALDNGEWETALAATQHWLQIAPDDPAALIILAKAKVRIFQSSTRSKTHTVESSKDTSHSEVYSPKTNRHRIPVWIWISGLIGSLTLLIWGGSQFMGNEEKASSYIAPTSTLSLVTMVSPTPTAKVILSASSTPLNKPTAKIPNESTPTNTFTPRPTKTPRPTTTQFPTSTETPLVASTATSKPTIPVINEPSVEVIVTDWEEQCKASWSWHNGGWSKIYPSSESAQNATVYGQDPTTFRWPACELADGHYYRITISHRDSDYKTVQDTTENTLTVQLPVDRYGAWEWTVEVKTPDGLTLFKTGGTTAGGGVNPIGFFYDPFTSP